MSRQGDNRDFIKGTNYPRQSYALSGSQWGNTRANTVRGKNPTDNSPMIVSPQPPGAFGYDDEAWGLVFGASMDAFLSLVNGSVLNNNKTSAQSEIPAGTVFKGVPSILTNNLYEDADSQQQIQYVVSKDNVEAASTARKFGTLSEARGLGMRIPMQAGGWGHTIAMRPTDPDPADKRLNDDEHKLDRASWKLGPIDMRWDPKRKVWRAWNDLVADQTQNNLGTFVFGTNTDNLKGFPFQRGKIEDAWIVRYADANGPINGNGDDTTKTAEVMTNMKHKLYDPEKNGAGPLWDIFVCHFGNPITVGNETTNIGGNLDSPPPDEVEGPGAVSSTLEIRTTAIYHYSDPIGGPIHFTAESLTPDEIPGKMKFVLGQWCPVIEIDRFEDLDDTGLCGNPVYANHMARLVQNDENIIEDGIFELQRFICEWNEEYTECILKHFRWVATNAGNAIWSLNFLLPPYVQGVVSDVASKISSSVAAGFTALRASIKATLNVLVAQIQACFRACCGEEFVCPIEILDIPQPPVGITYNVAPPFPVPGEPPPDCLIKSFASWQFEQGEELEIRIVNPCGGPGDYFASCDVPLVPGSSFGGTDDDGDNNIGGKEFGDPSAGDGSPAGAQPPGQNP